eukprot:1162137-Pelagomonas_calceolata.AAC.11
MPAMQKTGILCIMRKCHVLSQALAAPNKTLFLQKGPKLMNERLPGRSVQSFLVNGAPLSLNESWMPASTKGPPWSADD